MSWLINSHAWSLFVFAQFFLISYLSFKAQKQELPLIVVWLTGIFPTWTIICKYSNDLVTAGFIFDFMVVLGWTLGVIVFKGKEFGAYQYLGIILMSIGILVFKK